MKKYLSFIALSALALSLTACGTTTTNSKEETKTESVDSEKEILKIGTSDATPWTMVQDDGSIEGIGVTIMDELMNRMGYEYEWVVTDVPGMFGNMDSGRVDMSGLKLSLTPEREEKYAHSILYYWEPAKLVVKEDDSSIQTMEDLKGKTIAAGAGQVSEEFILKYKEEHDPNDEITLFTVDSGASDAVLAGHANAYIASEPNFNYRKKHNSENSPFKTVGEPLYDEESAFLFPKDVDKDFLDEFNKALQSMLNDGFLSTATTEFFGVDTSKPLK